MTTRISGSMAGGNQKEQTAGTCDVRQFETVSARAAQRPWQAQSKAANHRLACWKQVRKRTRKLRLLGVPYSGAVMSIASTKAYLLVAQKAQIRARKPCKNRSLR